MHDGEKHKRLPHDRRSSATLKRRYETTRENEKENHKENANLDRSLPQMQHGGLVVRAKLLLLHVPLHQFVHELQEFARVLVVPFPSRNRACIRRARVG